MVEKLGHILRYAYLASSISKLVLIRAIRVKVFSAFLCALCVSALKFRSVNFDFKKWCAIASEEVEATLKGLPKPLRERAGMLVVTTERRPNAGLQADGIEEDTLGLFCGPEFVEEEHVPMPPQIILFVENIWDMVEGDEKGFREEIRTTFLHELGHYFGLDEDGLIERGLE